MLEDAREANRENDAKHMRRNCELATLLKLPDLTALKRKYPVSAHDFKCSCINSPKLKLFSVETVAPFTLLHCCFFAGAQIYIYKNNLKEYI